MVGRGRPFSRAIFNLRYWEVDETRTLSTYLTLVGDLLQGGEAGPAATAGGSLEHVLEQNP